MARAAASRRHRTSGTSSGHFVAFLLIASLGILFAGCAPTPEQRELDEFTFSADDVAAYRELVQEADEEADNVMLLGSGEVLGTASLVESGSLLPAVALDLSMAQTYGAIRTGPGAVGDDLYRVTNEFLNVRAEPRVTAANLERLDRGDTMQVVAFTDAAWAKVKLASGKEGFVSTRYIAKVVAEDKLAEEKKAYDGQYFVDFGFLNVRKAPDAQSEMLGVLSGQAIIKPLSMDEVWARIPFEGKEGYVAVQYLSPFLPNFLVRQDQYTLPVLHYRLVEDGMVAALVQHIDRLKTEGYAITNLAEFRDVLVAQEERDVRLNPRTVALVISDVSPENVKEVSDALRVSNVTATLFIQTRHLGLSGITEKTILTLLANGLDLQSGGHTGEDVRSLTNAQVDLELTQSRQLLEQYTNKDVFAIGYPRGGVNERVEEKAAEAGYLLGVSTAPERMLTRAQLLRMPSFLITAGMSADEVMRIAKGS